jgi:hypothetical protein
MKKLTVKKTTIRPLTFENLGQIGGGVPTSQGTCLCSGQCTRSCTGLCVDTQCLCQSYGGDLC